MDAFFNNPQIFTQILFKFIRTTNTETFPKGKNPPPYPIYPRYVSLATKAASLPPARFRESNDRRLSLRTKSVGSWDLAHVHGLLISGWNAFPHRWPRIDPRQPNIRIPRVERRNCCHFYETALLRGHK